MCLSVPHVSSSFRDNFILVCGHIYITFNNLLQPHIDLLNASIMQQLSNGAHRKGFQSLPLCLWGQRYYKKGIAIQFGLGGNYLSGAQSQWFSGLISHCVIRIIYDDAPETICSAKNQTGFGHMQSKLFKTCIVSPHLF